MTLAPQIHQKGVNGGRQQGRQEGSVLSLQKSVISVLMVRFPSVTFNDRAAVQAIADETRLEQLLTVAVQAASIEDFSHQLRAVSSGSR